MIRYALSGDADQIARIHVRGWQTAYAGYMPRTFLDGLRVEKRAMQWRDWLAAQHFRALVFEEEARILGYAAFSIQTDVAELLGLYVDPDRKRRGIGSRLMIRFEDETRNAAKRGLWVLAENQPAITFYRKLGYEESGETKSVPFGAVTLQELRMEKQD